MMGTNPFISNLARDLKKNRKKCLKDMLKGYGDAAFFKLKQEEGYTKLQFGSGRWFHMDIEPEKYQRFFETARVAIPVAEAIRILAVWIFYHPDGRIQTFENLKLDALGWHRPGPKITVLLNNQSDLEEFLRDFAIELLPEKFQISELIRKE